MANTVLHSYKQKDASGMLVSRRGYALRHTLWTSWDASDTVRKLLNAAFWQYCLHLEPMKTAVGTGQRRGKWLGH